MKPLSRSPILFLLLLCFACNKEGIKPNTPANYFPNSIGDTWEYEVTDSAQYVPGSNNTINHYLVKVAIVGTKKLVDRKDASIWQYTYPFGIDTNYVMIDDNTIEIFNNNQNTIQDLKYPNLIFEQPFEVDKGWDGKHAYSDTFTVVNQANITTSLETFKDCFEIYRHYTGPSIELKDNYWFKPEVGMVSIYKNHYNSGPLIYSTWQLKTYSVH